MKQTAMQWLISQLNTWQCITDEDTNQTLDIVIKIINEAMEMEKEQIIDAYEDCSTNELGEFLTGKQYYNETYEAAK